MTRNYPSSVVIRDVGPRDGLQPENPLPPAKRVELIESLQDAGVSHLEIAAFVSPKAVPAMAGAADVVNSVNRRAGHTYAVLVPNLKGAQMALGTDVDELTVTLSISETYNQNNVHMSMADSEREIARIVDFVAANPRPDGRVLPVDAVVSCAFGSPYEGDIAPSEVAALGERLRSSGVTSLTFADTTGMATPRRVDDLLDALADAPGAIGLHLHDTRGLALTNAYAALERGVARFDTAVGGLGGSPFARGAGGNLATEALVAMLDDLGVNTGINLEKLIESAALIGALVGRDVPSMVARHGAPRNC